MVVVYYDSAIQEAFESLVRSIAGARNTLRKGKTTASFKARMSSLGMDDDPFAGATRFKMMAPKMMRPGVTSSRLGPDLLSDSKGSCFEDADKDLETAQNLCEVAAHQFLRDGDCRHEIEGTRKRFEACLAVAKHEVERLQEEDTGEKAEEVVDDQSTLGQLGIISRTPAPKDSVDVTVESKLEPSPLKQIHLPGTGTIEIDDGSEVESVHIDLSAIRRTRRI